VFSKKKDILNTCPNLRGKKNRGGWEIRQDHGSWGRERHPLEVKQRLREKKGRGRVREEGEDRKQIEGKRAVNKTEGWWLKTRRWTSQEKEGDERREEASTTGGRRETRRIMVGVEGEEKNRRANVQKGGKSRTAKTSLGWKKSDRHQVARIWEA